MAKGNNQKLKLIYLMKILLEKTDEAHSITMEEILASLRAYGISAERKSIYADIEALRLYGLDIVGEQRNRTYYYAVAQRQFELAELKLLVDAVQSSKFITARKSHQLIKKIEALASMYEASQLQRQVYVTERIKTMNESIYYNVDSIHSAINANAQIRFQYFQWTVEKQMELKKDGAFYQVSPWALSWDDENYYLVAYDAAAGEIRHYRVDKMLKIGQCAQPREGKELFERFDMGVYARKMFGMFGGEEQYVTIRFPNRLAGVVIDRFGKEISLRRLDGEYFTIHVEVALSRQFLAWVIGLGEDVQIISPQSVVERMQDEVRRLAAQYGLSEVNGMKQN